MGSFPFPILSIGSKMEAIPLVLGTHACVTSPIVTPQYQHTHSHSEDRSAIDFPWKLNCSMLSSSVLLPHPAFLFSFPPAVSSVFSLFFPLLSVSSLYEPLLPRSHVHRQARVCVPHVRLCPLCADGIQNSMYVLKWSFSARVGDAAPPASPLLLH